VNYYSPVVSTRADLQMKMGNEVRVNCSNCGKQDKKHLNRISATTDTRLIILGGVVGIICTVILLNFIGIIASVTCSFPFLVWQNEISKVRTFNRYAIKR